MYVQYRNDCQWTQENNVHMHLTWENLMLEDKHKEFKRRQKTDNERESNVSEGKI